MDEQEQLRSRLDEQRTDMAATVGQIENRVTPGRVAARNTWKVRNRLGGWRDGLMGSGDDEQDPYGATAQPGRADQARTAAHDAAGRASEAPAAARRTAKGNPLGVGVLAFGVGLVLASALPESRRERDAVRRAEPQLLAAAERTGEEARGAADEMRAPAEEAVGELKASASEKAAVVKDDATTHARDAKDDATA